MVTPTQQISTDTTQMLHAYVFKCYFLGVTRMQTHVQMHYI